jgi:hypothetical protein
MFLVLLVVPSLMAMQADFARQTRALRRAVAAPRLRAVTLANLAAISALFGATLGVAIWQGALPGFITSLLPGLAAAAPISAGLALFLGAVMVLLMLNWVVGAAAHAARRT